jgi:transcription initiation factor TFIIIB Brf1 subunit/transcription initiation factor TFIIB
VVEDADRVTQADAAAVADVTPVTVRNTYQALSE